MVRIHEGQLPLGKIADVIRGVLNGANELENSPCRCRLQLFRRDAHRLPLGEAVELMRVLPQRGIAAGAHLADDSGDRLLHLGSNDA